MNGSLAKCMEAGHLMHEYSMMIIEGFTAQTVNTKVKESTLRTLLISEEQRSLGNAHFDTLPKYCKDCPVLFACQWLLTWLALAAAGTRPWGLPERRR